MDGELFYCLAEHKFEQKAQLETDGGQGLGSTDVEDISVSLEHMFKECNLQKVQTSGFANSFVKKVAKQSGE